MGCWVRVSVNVCRWSANSRFFHVTNAKISMVIERECCIRVMIVRSVELRISCLVFFNYHVSIELNDK